MNRRRLLQAFAAATFAAVVEVTGIQLKVEAPAVPQVNPEYLTAEYEDVFIYASNSYGSCQPKKDIQPPPLNCRYKFENGQYIEVPKYELA